MSNEKLPAKRPRLHRRTVYFLSSTSSVCSAVGSGSHLQLCVVACCRQTLDTASLSALRPQFPLDRCGMSPFACHGVRNADAQRSFKPF